MPRWQQIVGCVVVAAATVIFSGCAGYRNSLSDLHGQDIAAAKSAEPNEPADQPAHAEQEILVHPWHKERVENIRSENIRQVIQNLANFDDGSFAETATSRMFARGSVRSEMGRVVRMFRVRRLFEEGARSPEQVLPLLRQTYKEALDAWPSARADHLEAAGQAFRERGGFTLSEPDAYNIANAKAVAMTYLLAELKDYDALPVLVEGYRLQARWMDELPPDAFTLVPVPTTMTLYAIHRLVRGMKPEGMSPAARTARQVYMDWAEKNLAEPTTLKGTAWNSLYDESDPYLRIIDREGKVLAGEPSIELPVYPDTWKDGTFLDGEDELGPVPMEIRDREKEWAKLLLTFAEATYSDTPN
jgi:hypothetical protein